MRSCLLWAPRQLETLAEALLEAACRLVQQPFGFDVALC